MFSIGALVSLSTNSVKETSVKREGEVVDIRILVIIVKY
jgi:hypothetical protein